NASAPTPDVDSPPETRHSNRSPAPAEKHFSRPQRSPAPSHAAKPEWQRKGKFHPARGAGPCHAPCATTRLQPELRPQMMEIRPLCVLFNDTDSEKAACKFTSA